MGRLSTTMAGTVILLCAGSGACREPSAADEQKPADKVRAERAERQRPAAIMAPAELPTSLPLLGREGVDADEYPTRYVDRRALRSLLWHKRYRQLTEYFEQYQAAFEKDPRKEYWPIDAASAFHSAEAELHAPLDAWVAASPKSFAPYLARATHWITVAYARRGGKWARKTPGEDMLEMGKALDRAVPDLDKALALRPKLVAARRLQIQAFAPRGEDAKQREAIDRALVACPSCFQVRVTYLLAALAPRWGGSYAAMRAFVRKRADRSNKKMRLLGGYIYSDQANMLRHAKRYKEALAMIERACALGDHWDFLQARAGHQMDLKNPLAALLDLNRALAMRPEYPELLVERAFANSMLKRHEAAGRDLAAALRISPTESGARRALTYIVKWLVYDGWEHYKAGRRKAALRVLELAAELAPRDPEVQRRKAYIISHARLPPRGAAVASGPTEGEIAALQQRAAAAPNDLRAHQQLDYALAHQGRFTEVVKLWDGFIARNPRSGHAYLERGGAYYHLRRAREAHADATRACELGVSEGCVRAKQLASRVR